MQPDNSILTDLDRFGPDAPSSGDPMPLAVARAYVHTLATGHYENFSVLSRLVPADLRDDFAAVYAYCRWSDDLGDETGSTPEARQRSLELLSWWRSQLQRCFDSATADDPDTTELRHPVFIALAESIRRHALQPEPFHHLIDAFEQDQRITAYETWDQLLDYCTRSANPVGRIVLALGGHGGDKPGDAQLIALSDATCTALQLTNFWQDVRRDLLERDRVYLPSSETGITPEMLRTWVDTPNDPAARVAYIKALRPLVERTRTLFEHGSDLPATLNAPLSPVIWLFGAGGHSVLRQVERTGCTTLWTRPSLSRRKKVSLVFRATLFARFGKWSRHASAASSTTTHDSAEAGKVAA